MRGHVIYILLIFFHTIIIGEQVVSINLQQQKQQQQSQPQPQQRENQQQQFLQQQEQQLVNVQFCDNLTASIQSSLSSSTSIFSSSNIPETFISTFYTRDGAKYPFWIQCNTKPPTNGFYSITNNDKQYFWSSISPVSAATNLNVPIIEYKDNSSTTLVKSGGRLSNHHHHYDQRYNYLFEVSKTCENYLLKQCPTFKIGILSQELNKCPICGYNDLCTSECGQVKSINYPFNYGNNHRCRWSIRAPDGHYVNLSIIDFDIPSANNATKLGTCIFDHLTLLDGYTGKRLGCYCNENLPPPHIVSPWNEMIIQFDTNSETTGRGFYFTYEFMKLELSENIKRQLKLPNIINNNDSYNNSKDDNNGKGYDYNNVMVTGINSNSNNNNNSIVCFSGWQYFRGSCYRAFSELEPLQWYDAENKCNFHGKGLDGHLVSILDKDEMLVILYFLTNIWKSIRYRVYYIGLIDVSREGVYRWSDNNPMSYTDWELKPMLLEEEMPAQPDGGAYEDCTVIRYNSFSRTSNWHDVPCSLGKHYHSSYSEKNFQLSYKWDYVHSYICKSDSISITSTPRSKVRRPLFSNEFIPLIQSSLISHLSSASSGSKAIQHQHQPQQTPIEDSNLNYIVSSNETTTSNWSNGTALRLFDYTAQKNRLYLSSMLDDNRYFVCDNLEVISVVLRCDGIAHCRDGSDESNGCNQDCLDWQYKCANGRCISIGYYCDFVDDCGDGSDESRCERHRCKLNEFRCQSGQCIMATQRCDLLPDCSDSSDEGRLCTIGSNCNSASTFQCYNGNCIPQYAVCDFQIDCPGKFHEDEDVATCDLLLKNRSIDYKFYSTNLQQQTTELSSQAPISTDSYQTSMIAYYQAAVTNQEAANWKKDNLFKCTSGNVIDNNLRCLFEFDRYGYQIGCRDVSHLIDCSDFECPSRDYVKCSNSYCIPWRYICDGKWDCIMGDDEVGCARYVCPGQYKCANQSSCILLHQLCDGHRQCPMGDDEWYCDLQCPLKCDCIGHSVNCNNANLSILTSNYISKSVRKLDLSYNNLGPNLSNSDFSAYHDLGELILHHNNIEVLTPRKFHQLRNLYKLDLSNNQIHSVKRGAFAGLRRVTQLLLESNPELVILEPEAFLGLSSLQMLNISSSRILALRKNTFDGLTSLRHLLLRSNMIVEIEDGAFRSLTSLVSLDMRGNEIRYFTKVVFNDLKSLRNLSTDSFKFCCLMNHQIPADRCLPLPDEISDCEDLLSSVLQRTCIWIAGITACIGNSIVIIWHFRDRIGQKVREEEQVNSTLVLSLHCSDLLMGIYLIIIASVDSWYRGRYIENSDNWRESILCNLCGFLSTVSSEVSVFTLVSMALNRYTEICLPMNSPYKFTLDYTHRLISAFWFVAFTIATLPLLITPYFRGQFYARSGVCLGFHITNQKAAGWLYAIGVYLCVNLVAFIIIVTCYTKMYKHIKLKRDGPHNRIERPNHPIKIALIVITSFVAWMPTIILGFIALAGIALPAAVYSWIAVLVLPVNSAINPMIYTIPNIGLYIRSMRNYHRTRKSASNNHVLIQMNQTNNGQAKSLLTANNGERRKLEQRNIPPGYVPIKDFINQAEHLTTEHLISIALEMARDIEEKHQRDGKVYASLSLDSVLVSDKIASPETRPSSPISAISSSTTQTTSQMTTNNPKISVFLTDYDGYRVKKPHCTHKDQSKKDSLQHNTNRHHRAMPNCECSDVKKFGDTLISLIKVYSTKRLNQREEAKLQQHQIRMKLPNGDQNKGISNHVSSSRAVTRSITSPTTTATSSELDLRTTSPDSSIYTNNLNLSVEQVKLILKRSSDGT